jgi:hypothetical protein
MRSVRNYNDESQIDFDSVYQLDVEGTGMIRLGMLTFLYVDPDTEYVVSESEESIVGYGMSRLGRLGPYIGPIVARSSEVAIGIVSRLLERFAPTADSPVFIDVPQGSSIEPWLKAEGFEVVRSWTRMFRGGAERGNSEMYFAIAGPELG